MGSNNIVLSPNMPNAKVGHFVRCLGWDFDKGGLQWEFVPFEALQGRMAVCPHCNRTVASSTMPTMFEYRGGENYDNCRRCGMKQIAHEPGRTGHGHTYEQGPRDTDLFYDGCRGWD